MFIWAVDHQMFNGFTMMTTLGKGRKFAFFCMMTFFSTIIAPAILNYVIFTTAHKQNHRIKYKPSCYNSTTHVGLYFFLLLSFLTSPVRSFTPLWFPYASYTVLSVWPTYWYSFPSKRTFLIHNFYIFSIMQVAKSWHLNNRLQTNTETVYLLECIW